MSQARLTSLVRSAFLEASEEFLKGVSETATVSLTSSLAKLLVVAGGAGVVDLCLQFLRLLVADKESSEKLAAGIEKLVKQPLVTGLEQLRLATDLPKGNSLQADYAASRARDALVELDRAWALVEASQRPGIDLLRGAAASLIPGAEAEASRHFRSFMDAAQAEVDDLQFRARAFEADSQGLSIQADRFFGDEPNAGAGLWDFEAAAHLLRRERLQRRAREERQRAEELQKEAHRLLELIALLERIVSTLTGSVPASTTAIGEDDQPRVR